MNTWNKASSLASDLNTKRGLQASVLAGALCKQAELLYPGLFHAVSVRKGVLRLEVPAANMIQCKLIEGELQKELQTWAARHNFPVITKVTLTITPV